MRRNVVLVLVPLAIFCAFSLLDLAGAASATGTASHTPENNSRNNGQLENDRTSVLPDRFGNLRIDSSTYLELRDQHTALLRGIAPDFTPDLSLRNAAIQQMKRQETAAAKAASRAAGPLHLES